MNKDHVLDRLELLVTLCGETEPDVPDDKTLFTGQYVAAKEMLEKVANKNFHLTDYSMTDIMKQANKLWKMRNKVKNGEWDNLEHSVMIEDIEDFIAQNQKINAIKYYRNEMKEKFDDVVSLREAKEFVDQLQVTMKSRGMIA
jgi:ribosomal protein L7/L12